MEDIRKTVPKPISPDRKAAGRWRKEMRKIIKITEEEFKKINNGDDVIAMLIDYDLPLKGGFDSFRKTEREIIINDIGCNDVSYDYILRIKK